MIPPRYLAGMSVACGVLALLIYLYPAYAPSFGDSIPSWGLALSLGLVLAALAFLLGEISSRMVKSGRGAESERSMARLGQWLGGGWFVLVFFLLIYFPPATSAPTRARVAHVTEDLHMLARVLHAYMEDNGTYPPAVDKFGRPVLVDEGEISAGFMPWMVTTPMAYIAELPVDLFNEGQGDSLFPYRYATDGKTCWILSSNGPDGMVDTDVSALPAKEIASASPGAFLTRFGRLQYDPSNGAISPGDIIRSEAIRQTLVTNTRGGNDHGP